MTDMGSTSVSRRTLLGSAVGVTASAALLGVAPVALSATADVDAAIQALIGDAEVKTDGRISLDLPEIAENGNTVPVAVTVDSPMTGDDYVKSVHVFAADNPLPEVITFKFTPASGVASASTRMRLARTQMVVAVAELSDGSVIRTQREVKVTIGGCGG